LKQSHTVKCGKIGLANCQLYRAYLALSPLDRTLRALLKCTNIVKALKGHLVEQTLVSYSYLLHSAFFVMEVPVGFRLANRSALANALDSLEGWQAENDGTVSGLNFIAAAIAVASPLTLSCTLFGNGCRTSVPNCLPFLCINCC
jgi:hypothetical protein